MISWKFVRETLKVMGQIVCFMTGIVLAIYLLYLFCAFVGPAVYLGVFAVCFLILASAFIADLKG